MLSDRFDQFRQRFTREILPRLQWTRHDAAEIDLLNFFAGLGFEPDRGRPRADQRAKTFAESRLCHQEQVIGSGVIRQTKTHLYSCS
jgi:hypothetical protein